MSEEASVEVPSVQEILQELREADLVQGEAELTALTGGVSCEVWRIRAEDLCEQVRQANPHGLVVKAPLATLRTPSLWRADTSRGFAEAKALELYGRLTPRSVPRVVWRHPTAPVMVVEAARNPGGIGAIRCWHPAPVNPISRAIGSRQSAYTWARPWPPGMVGRVRSMPCPKSCDRGIAFAR